MGSNNSLLSPLFETLDPRIHLVPITDDLQPELIGSRADRSRAEHKRRSNEHGDRCTEYEARSPGG